MTVDPQLLTGLGAALAIFLTAAGSAHASAHAGIFALRETNYKYFVPIVQAGVLSIYGIIIAVLLAGKLNSGDEITTEAGYRHLSAGLAVGLGVLASGCGMACFLKQLNEGKACCVATPAVTPSNNTDGSTEPLIAAAGQNNAKPPEPTNFKKLVMIMVYLEAIGLYGLIVSLLLIGGSK